MKRNILFIVIDSVTNDILFNKNNSKNIAPFLNKMREVSISGNKMYSEAPYTEAALMSLLGGIDTMDNGGYLERMKNTKSVLDYFLENGYKTFFSNYYPSVYPSHMIGNIGEKKYFSGFNFNEVWEYRLKYYSELYLKGMLSEKEENIIIDILEDNLNHWIVYLEKIKNDDIETSPINNCIDKKGISQEIKKISLERNKFLKDKNKYIENLFLEKEKHILFKMKSYNMTDKVRNENFRNRFHQLYMPTFKKIKKLDFIKNIKNNKLPIGKLLVKMINGDFSSVKGLLAAYKNSLIDKDLYDRINGKYDLFKSQKSFYSVSLELFKWINKHKKDDWMAYVHIDDAHYPESFFTYDTDDENLVKLEIKRINEYLDSLPKNYQGNIAYDLSLHYCDSIIEKIYKYLEKENLLEKTDIVITADHGFSYYFSPIREKYVISSYNENYNVPFIVYSKKQKHKMISDFCQTKDIPVTLLDLANIKPKGMKGKSLLKYNGEKYAYLEYMGGGCPDVKRRPINLGIRTDNYSVVMDIYINKRFRQNEIKEVYNLKKDPNENYNLNKRKHIEKDIEYELHLLELRYKELLKQYNGIFKENI